MLVLDPKKRYTIEQIRRHRWMKAGDEETSEQHHHHHQQQQQQVASSSSSSSSLHSGSEYDEQILKLMHALGIEPCKTVEVLGQRRIDSQSPREGRNHDARMRLNNLSQS